MISSLSALLDTAKSRLIVTTVACGCVFIDFMTYAHAMPEIERDFDFRFRGGSGAALLVTLVLGAGILAYKSLVGAPEHKTKKEVEAKHKDSLLISEKTLLGLVTPQAATAQDVDVTVFAPPAAAPNEDVLVQVIFHTLDREAEARSRAAKVDEAAMALASIPLTIQVLPNDLIKATLECDGTIISEAIQTTNWNGRLVCLYFSMRLPDVTAETKLRPVLRVFVNGIPAGKVVFKLIVAPNVPNYPFSFAHDTVHAFRRPFLSYASEDRVHVLKAAQLMGALKMKFFQDVLTLSPGDRWERRLYSEIDDCDVFLLFWSQAASASKWVVMEAEYALRRAKMSPPDKRLEIVPILLEGPPPPSPPPALSEIHFNDPIRYAIFGEESIRMSKAASNSSSGSSDVVPSAPLDRRIRATGPTHTIEYDRNRWHALLKYDDTISQVAAKLQPLGQRWVDEFAKTYLSVNDKSYLPNIVQKIIADARDEDLHGPKVI